MLDSLCILMPVYDDWEAVRLLLPHLDSVATGLGLEAEVVLINDGSPSPAPQVLMTARFPALRRLEVVTLKRTVGHQRALAVGLVHIWQTRRHCTVAVMDADGEDSPDGIPSLLRRLYEPGAPMAVFAERTKRAEGLAFRLSYAVFRRLHRMLSGVEIRVGNFSVLSPAALERLVVTPEIWNHYAGSVLRSRLPFATVPIARAPRLAGRSKMNAVSLVQHGLSAISLFADAVSVRMFLASGGALVGTAVGAMAAWLAGFTGIASALAWVAAALVPLLAAALGFALSVLGRRSQMPFVPVRECPDLIAGVWAAPVSSLPYERRGTAV